MTPCVRPTEFSSTDRSVFLTDWLRQGTTTCHIYREHPNPVTLVPSRPVGDCSTFGTVQLPTNVASLCARPKGERRCFPSATHKG